MRRLLVSRARAALPNQLKTPLLAHPLTPNRYLRRMQPELLSVQPDTFTVYLARHATPERARPDLPYHIPPGPMLTERGLQEAAELGSFLREAGVMRLFASPLERAWRTASIAGEIIQAPLELDLDLAEWRPDEVEKTVAERAWRAFGRSAQLSAQLAAPVTLVTHGGPVLLLLKALGMPEPTVQRYRIFDSRNPIPMAGAWRVERSQGTLQIQLVFGPTGVKIPDPMTGLAQ
jgi:2,3-bisphosphoglycerate-dependent phosphoglycerate mutase